MDIKIVFSVISVLAGLTAFYPYFKDVLAKRTQPHEFTWLIWAITQGTATAGVWAGGGGVGAISLTVGTFLVTLIFIMSLMDGKRDITKSDVVLLIVALLAIAVWWFLENPLLAVFMVIGIDVIGYIPTFRKSFKHPWAETAKSWALFPVSNIFAILALESYNLLTTSYLVIICVLNISLLVFLLARRKNIPMPSSKPFR